MSQQNIDIQQLRMPLSKNSNHSHDTKSLEREMDGESMVNIIEFEDEKSHKSPTLSKNKVKAEQKSSPLTPNRMKEPLDSRG